MTLTTPQILKILYVLSWILFVGICIEAGGFIFNAIFTLTINPIDAKHFWQEVDLSSLYAYDHGHFFAETFAMSIVAVLRAIMFYLIIKLLHDDKLNMKKPFSRETLRFIFSMSYIALLIGLFSWWGVKYSDMVNKTRGENARHTIFTFGWRGRLAVHERNTLCNCTNLQTG